jgi:hypothetical protein
LRTNLSQAEQIARAVIGSGLIILAGLDALDGVWRVSAVVLGSVGVFTAAAAYCPLHRFPGLGRIRPTRPTRPTRRA